MDAALVKTASEFRKAFGMMELTKGSYFGSVSMTNALDDIFQVVLPCTAQATAQPP